jgi:hypothetical protein
MNKNNLKWLWVLVVLMVVLKGWSQRVHVYNENSNVMWKGITNKMGLSVDGKLKNIWIDGGIMEYSQGLYQAMFDSAGDMDEWKYMQDSGYVLIKPDCDARSVEVGLEYIDSNGETRKATRTFRPISVDFPEVVYQGKNKNDQMMSRGLLNSGLNSGVFLKLDPSSLKEGLAFECLAFEVDVTHDRKTQTFRCNGNQFSGSALKALEKLAIGDYIVIRDVQTFMPCGVVTLKDRLELVIN